MTQKSYQTYGGSQSKIIPLKILRYSSMSLSVSKHYFTNHDIIDSKHSQRDMLQAQECVMKKRLNKDHQGIKHRQTYDGCLRYCRQKRDDKNEKQYDIDGDNTSASVCTIYSIFKCVCVQYITFHISFH
eukprot:1130781_1